MSIDIDKIVERVRSRIVRQNQDVAVVGWRGRDHNGATEEWRDSGRVHFHERLPDSGLPKAVSLILFTTHVNNGDYNEARKTRDCVSDKLPPQVVKQILGRIALPLAPVQETAPAVPTPIVAEEIDTDSFESFVESLAREPLSAPPFLERPVTELEEVNDAVEEEAVAEEDASVSTTDNARIGFAKEFCQKERELGDALSAHATNVIAKKYGISPWIYKQILRRVSNNGSRIGHYCATPELYRLAGLEVVEEPDTSAEVEPTDPIEKAQWLIINLEYFEGQRDVHQEEVDRFETLIKRSRAASLLLDHLKEV